MLLITRLIALLLRSVVPECTRLFPLAAVLLFAASHASAALAIDCTSATSKVDQVVCSSRTLSSQDAELNKDYDKAMSMLSPDGRSALRADQRRWLQYRATACGFDRNDGSRGDESCLIQQFVRRDRVLHWFIGWHDGQSPYAFSMRSAYKTSPDPSGGLPFWSETSIPQIDPGSLSPSVSWSDAEAWNTMIAKLIGGPEQSSACLGGKGNIYKDPEITVASVLLIGVRVTRDDQCHGPGPTLVIVRGPGPFRGLLQTHFMSETQYNIVMMRGDVHELEPSDLFSSGDGWKRLLTERVEAAVRQASPGAIRKLVTDPSNWILGGDAFHIRVNQDALAPYAVMNGFTVDIPWSDLQGVLSFKGKRILNARDW